MGLLCQNVEMHSAKKCPECGAFWLAGRTCPDDFHQMLAWEVEYPHLGEVHHLLVLCFYLQHPSLYSAEGLTYARQLLTQFLEEGVTPAQIRKQKRLQVDSGRRTWKIKGTATAFGAYGRAIEWAITAADVVAKGPDNYCNHVKAWAHSVHEAIKSVEQKAGGLS